MAVVPGVTKWCPRGCKDFLQTDSAWGGLCAGRACADVGRGGSILQGQGNVFKRQPGAAMAIQEADGEDVLGEFG